MIVQNAPNGMYRRLAAPTAAFAAALLAFAAFAAGNASATEGPRWKMGATTSPTYVHANAPRDEVQKLTVGATAGTYTLTVQVAEGAEGKGGTTAALPYNATAAEIEEALTKTGTLQAGDVSVTGGPTEFEITFQGYEQGNAPVAVMTVDGSSLQGGGASVAEVAKGLEPPQLILTATNVGGGETNGAVTVSDTLPAWLKATRVIGYDSYASIIGFSLFTFAGGMSCDAPPAIKCTYSGKVDPGDQLMVYVELESGSPPLPGAANEATVEGGGATTATQRQPLEASSAIAPFGPVPGSAFAAVSTDQAGAHPNLVTSFLLATKEAGHVAGQPRDVRFDLPPGLVGNTADLPKCDIHRVMSPYGSEGCPRDTMVGTATTFFTILGTHPGFVSWVQPVYNITPAPGEPAAFGFDAIILPVRLDTTVLSNGDYGVRVTAAGLTQGAPIMGSTVTIWGVPADHSGPGSNEEYMNMPPNTVGGPDPGQSRLPLMTNPQQCTSPLVGTMSADSWSAPGAFQSTEAPTGTMSGCLNVPFGSSFSFLPDTEEAGQPAGYHFELFVKQQNSVGTLATSSVREVQLTLPQGVVVNPSAAWGLKACSEGEFYGPAGGPRHPVQAPAPPANCPNASKVGEVEVESPDLEKPLKGDVFLGTPECEPCTPKQAEDGEMVKLYLQLAGEGENGLIVKLEGHGLIDQATGQITTVFKEAPQLPFSRMKFVLEGGPRAVLANPRTCGPVRAVGDLQPWSVLQAPGEAALVSDSRPFYEFEINQNCFGAQFTPSFVAGSPNIQSGAYTPFTLSFGRSDNDEFLAGIKQTMPPGLLGNLSNVPLCKEPEAAQGTCGSGSVIGRVQVLTGPGADPFLVSGGQVFLTEGYEGAPYGLSIVVPAVAGPYTLSGTTGKGTVVVRAKIEVDPLTAALTVTSDPLPTVLDGIPLQLKAVNVTIDKPDFTFNPTSCAKMAIGATLSSSEGMSASKSSSFQVTNCASLGFKPSFSASTNGKTSRRDGASLTVKLSYPKAAFGSQANIRSVKVDLPRQLPSFLETLQHACPDSTFNQNPAACPKGSRVGSATATTPILPVPLVGPAYFVSHGGAKFPELVIVLSGYGTTVYLHGETFIKNGITSSTFRTIPDVPVESFQLTLPQGPNHALAANGNLCALTRVVTRRTRVRVKRHGRTRVVTRKVHKRIAASLLMPTAFTAQNGMVIHQSTPIAVTGCVKHKPHHKHHNKHKHHKKK